MDSYKYFGPYIPSSMGPTFGGPAGSPIVPGTQPEITSTPGEVFTPQSTMQGTVDDYITKWYPQLMEVNEQYAKKKDERTREMLKNYYSDIMESLKKANLNPTLLFGGGLGGDIPATGNAMGGTPNMLSGGLGDLWGSKEKRDKLQTFFNLLASIGLMLMGAKK